MISSMLLSFALTSLIIELTPGPNMVYLAIVGASVGRKAGYAATAGIALGLLIVGVAAALGLAALISNSPLLYQFLRWGGIVYLLWLAWEGWRESDDGVEELAAQQSTRKYFVRGLITNLLNPKAGLFYIAVLPGFVDPAMPLMTQLIMLSVVYVSIATFIHFSIVSLASTARRFLEHPTQGKLLRRFLALALALVAIWFGWSTQSNG